jgi:flagellar hook-associated protein 1 FlgK
VTVVAQDEAQVNVFIGNGQTLVLAGNSADVTATHNAYDPNKLDINLTFAGGTPIDVTSALSGGSIGGVLDFQHDMLDPTINALGRIAVGFSMAFNAQHQLGLDLNDSLGSDFFADLSQNQSIAGSYNDATTDYVFTSTVTDVGALKNSDYRIDYVGGTYTVRRVSDDTVVAVSGVPTIDLTATEGFSISVAGATINSGDSFLLKPVGNGAADFRLLINDTTFIAAAGPLRTSAPAANTGSGKISAGSVSNATNLPLAAPITLTYNPNALGAGVPGFTVAGGPGGTLAYNPATEFTGKEFTFAAYGGFTFTVSGVPANGDQFVIQNNTGATGDNRNALALAAFQTDDVLINGAGGPTASVLEAYSQLVSDVGARTHRAEIDNTAHQTLLAQAQEAWSNVAGVNLDEEAANLVRYQQAYQAAAQVVSAAQLMFDTLLGAVRR